MDTGRVDVNQVLMQMRQIKAQMQQNRPADVQNPADNQIRDVKPEQRIPATGAAEKADAPSFGDMFKSAVDTVNENQQAASSLATRYEQGDPRVDLPEVMIALQKSSVSFQAMTQVRNKMVEAYKEVMNMSL